MYIALAARPLPKWFHLILSVLLFNLSCATVYVYIMARNVTTSTERFESVPSYVVAVLFFISGCLSLSMTKSIINDSLRVAQVGVALSLVAIIVSLVAVICTLWLTDVQDKFIMCIYNAQHSECLCRNDNITDSQDGDWYVYEHITGCNRLDSLNRCMIASIALDAVGAFICFLAFSNFGLIWVRKKTEERSSQNTNENSRIEGNNAPNASNSSNRQITVVSTGPVAVGGISSHNGQPSTPSPVATPGAHSDWDGWLFSHPFFRQMFSEFRHIWFPPTYEQSQMSPAVPTVSPQARATDRQRCISSGIRSASAHTSALTCGGIPSTIFDYPPPPYSKSPRRRHGSVEPKRSDGSAVNGQVINSTASNSASQTRPSDMVVATQSCV